MKKIKNIIKAFLLISIALLTVTAAWLFVVPNSLQTAEAATQSDLVFEYIGANGYSVKAKDSSISGKIIIPDYYDDGTHGRKKVYDIENFNNCTNLTEVEVQGNSLWGISDKAFEGCKNLNKIILPDSLRRIGDEAFSGCTSLTEITLPIGISELGFTRSPFYDFADRGFTIIYKGTKSEWNKKTGRLLVPAFVTIVYLGDMPNKIQADIEDYGVTNQSVTVDFFGYKTEGYYSSNASSMPDSANTRFGSGRTFTADGNYLIEARNNYSDSVYLHFTIDKTAPVGELHGVEDKGYTNGEVTFTWSEEGATATLNGSDYISGTPITAEQEHTIVITDKVGNSRTYTFTIDKTAPTGELHGVKDKGYTNSEVTFTWPEDGATATLNGSNYISGTPITAEQKHEIVLTDRAGNSTTYTFTIDKTAPVGELHGVEDKGYTNGEVSFTWSEDGATATLNGVNYESGVSISEEREHTIVLTDKAGNSTTYTFTIDKTAPEGVLNGVTNGGYTNKSVTFTWSEKGAKATLNGKEYSSGTSIIAERYHEIVLTDKLGNSRTYTFTIDKTAPEGVLNGVEDKGYTNGEVSFTWSEDGATATLNGSDYISGTPITAEQKHEIVLTDRAGNSTTYTFTIDKAAPVGELHGVSNGGYTMGKVTFTWSDKQATATLNDREYLSGTSITAERTHKIVLTDKAGNSTTYTFTIDKTAPVGELHGVDDKGHTNSEVTFTWSEEGATATLNGSDYISGTPITAEQKHEIVLTDRAGNSTTYTFTIDKTAPVGELHGVEDKGYTNGEVTFTWSEESATATLNDKDYTSGRKITEERTHKIVLTDKAGNSTTYTFTIDKTAPTGILHGVEDKGYTNGEVSFTWSEDGATAKLNGSNYASGTPITAEQKHEIVLTDRAGNSTTYTFTIDKAAPVGELHGVEDKGYTNGEVTFTWSEESATATLNDKDYTSGRKITEERTHKIVLTDKAGNSTTYTFTIDKTAPTGILHGVEDKGYTNGEVSFTWSEVGATAKLNGSDYISGTPITAEQKHEIVLTDRAGNSTTYTFTIDKAAPVGELHGVEDKGYTNGEVSFTWSEVGATATLNGVGYKSGVSVSEEREHTIVLTDKAGNSTTYTFTIDKTPPQISPFTNYVHDKFTLTAEDSASGVSHWEYSLNSGESKSYSGKSLTIGGGIEDNGEWQIRVFDNVGNVSARITIYYALRTGFGNSDEIYNLFTVPSYYVVTLSQKNYASCFGSYTFSDYEYALEFAKSKEWECRVIDVDGSSWNYVTPNNENARMIYKDRKELETTIEKYAVKNISDRKVIGPSGVVLNNPTDSSLKTRADALTVQLSELPGILSGYSEYKFMLALGSYEVKLPDSIVEGNKSTFTIKFISDGISLREGSEIPIEYGAALNTVCQEEGWYLVTESDVCGNIEKYLIFIDSQHPEINARVTYGNGGQEDIKIDESYINAHSETMRYVEFSVSSIADNIDDYTFVLIKGRNLEDVRFVSTDELPILSYDNGYYGAYTITIYDRSLNKLSFVVYIAGEAPSLKNSSLTNETAVTFTVQINDSYNEITDIKFFKVLFDGTEERIYTDSFGTEVNAQNLVYKMNVGGKYLFEFTDLYGRVVRTKPLFYMKGLPSATLRGVKDGGLTKNDVSILYDKDATLELFIYVDGEWQTTENYEYSEGISVNTISITAGEDTTAIYKALLYVTADRNLFTEYTFEIDGILPVVEVKTESYETVEPGTVITENFFLTWSESGYTVYYKKQGAISDAKYAKGTLISAAGTYEFTIRDRAYNEVIFTVTLDNLVSYTLEGSYVLAEGGGYITRGYFKLTITEPFSVFKVNSSNGIEVRNGQRLDIDGTYDVHVEDSYGNELNLKLIIDKLPPVPVITTSSGATLADGSRTRESFRVGCEEKGVNITYSDGGSFNVYDGNLIEQPGKYTFKLADAVGNATNVSIILDLSVDYRVDGNYTVFDGDYYSKYRVTVVTLEELTTCSLTIRGGEAVTGKSVNAEGIYDVRLVDLAGNEATFSIIIDRTAPVAKVKTASGKELGGNFVTNEAFTVECEEEDAVIEVTFNGEKEAYNGKQLDEVGKYSFTVSDKLGNTSEFTVEIDREVDYRIDGEYIQSESVYSSKSWLQVVVNEATDLFEISSISNPNQRVSQEGTYTVRIRDIAGNEATFTLVIDKTAPQIKFETSSGKPIDSGSATNEPFKIICEEEGAKITYRLNKGEPADYLGGFLSDSGKYVVVSADKLGNMSEFTVEIDREVDYRIEGEYIQSESVYSSKSWLQVVVNEVTDLFEISGKDGGPLDASQRVSQEGTYTVRIRDIAGNEATFSIIIDRTAPVAKVKTASGKELEGNFVTNEAFTVECEEEDAVIEVTFNGEKEAYSGKQLDEVGKYSFTVSDKLGNTSEFTVKIDREVDYRIDGEYIQSENVYSSKSWLQVVVNEATGLFEISGQDGGPLDASQRVSQEGTYTVSIRDLAGNEATFTLVIDKTAPVARVELKSGLEWSGSVINEPFKVVCESEQEEITKSYSFNFGIPIAYTGEWLSKEGIYNFTLQDELGNIGNLSVRINYTVMYEVSGNYIFSDGDYYSRNWLKVEVLEVMQISTITAHTGENPVIGQIINAEGIYDVRLVDLAGNEATFSIIIDRTAPVAKVKTASGKELGGNFVTNEAFTVECEEEDAVIEVTFNGEKEAYSGKQLDEVGKYSFTVSDKLGNTSEFTVEIDREVDYRIEGEYIQSENVYSSKSWLQVVVNEATDLFEISGKDGGPLDASQRVSQEGTYTVRIRDLAGNEATFSIIIDRTAPVAKVKTASGKELGGNFVTNEAFTVECEEEDAVIEVTFNGEKEAYSGKQLDEVGKYSFTVSDKLGNTSEFTVEIDREVDYRIEGEYIQSENVYSSKSWLQVVVNEATDLFEISGQDDGPLDASQRVSQEGTYTVTIRDLAGNEATFTLVIDKTAPQIKFETSSGKPIDSGSATNEPFKIICEEEGAKITYRLNKGEPADYLGDYLSEEGVYLVTVADFLGTSAEHSIVIDISVRIKINGTYVMDPADRYISKNWLSVSAEENMQELYLQSRDGTEYDAEQRITDEGEYECVAIDELGNRLVLVLIIDKTSPVISLAGVVEGGATNSNVTVSVEDYSQIYYRHNGSEKTAAYNGINFDAEGEYAVIASDLVGNTSSVLFSIDKHVDVIPNLDIVYGQFITGEISFEFGENVTASLVHDGVESSYIRGKITEVGSYMLNVSDDCGNNTAFAWEIIPEKAKSYSIIIPDGYEIVCELNGELYDTGISGDNIVLTASGDYKLLFTKEDMSFVLEITVDNIAPSVEVETTRKSVIISNPNKENMTYTLYYNGKPTAFNLKKSAEITQVGSYRLVCTDEVGNVAEYIFELNYLSDISIALICVVSALVVLGIVAIIAFRFRRRIF